MGILNLFFLKRKKAKAEKVEEKETITKLLNYSFQPIHWDYKGLTTAEKNLISREEFEKLKVKYKI